PQAFTIRRYGYATRQEARSDVFSYIEMFYNPIRRHSSADGLSPVEFERRNSVRLKAI
uniref:IS3 family transposase n=1 Tax=Comamonas sp. TaxID=34028 RepID=UPI00289DC296